MTQPEPTNRDWLDQLVEEVTTKYPKGELIVASGHSPSGTYHVGTLREVMTANAVTWALRQAGREAKHIDFVDDFDAFRKLPAGISEDWIEYIGQPLALVPDPFTCHESYGAHFLAQLYDGLEALGAMPDETVYGYKNYQTGGMNDQIELALDKLATAREVLTEVGGRQLDENWSPLQILDEDNNLRTLRFKAWDKAKKTVTWESKTGTAGTTALTDGKLKLDWRLDWPARWAKWGVNVEPFGRDHASKGGSYDTGEVLVARIFDGQAPYPVPYEFINTAGETKKMSKSAGNVLTPQQALEVMPPEILRYFVIKARPSRTLMFDPGVGLYQLIDEYSAAQTEAPTGAMAYAQANVAEPIIAAVPFNHLVAVYQAAQGDEDRIKTMLERTGFGEVVKNEWPVAKRELGFVKNWLGKYAPESVKFSVQDELPKVELSDEQKAFLGNLADSVAAGELDGQGMHEAIYAAAEAAGLKPGPAFVAIYRVILGQDSGPKAGWFLASLDRDWLARRLRLLG